MKVKELTELLKKYPEDADIICEWWEGCMYKWRFWLFPPEDFYFSEEDNELIIS